MASRKFASPSTIMNKFQLNQIPLLFNSWLFKLLIILFLALILRMLFIWHLEIAFDNSQIIAQASQIKSGNLTLIGPKTGPAGFFTGPLIYYVTALSLFFFDKYFSIMLVPLLLALATGISVFITTNYLFNQTFAVKYLSLWAVTPMLVILDKTLWNPNLLFLASSLLFLPLFSKENKKWTPFILGLGAFLAYQAHFTGLILILLTVIILFLSKKPQMYFLGLLIGTVISLLPTIIFDFRNDFLNFRGLMQLAEGSAGSSGPIIHQFTSTFFIIFNFPGLLFSFNHWPIAQLSISLCFWIILFLLHKKKLLCKQQSLSITAWLLILWLIFSLYSGEKPEYYFIGIIAPIFAITIVFLSQLKRFWFMIFILSLTFISLYSINQFFSQRNAFSIISAQKVEEFLLTQKISKLSYGLPNNRKFGYEILLADLPKEPTGAIIRLIYPVSSDSNVTEVVAGMGVLIEKNNQE